MRANFVDFDMFACDMSCRHPRGQRYKASNKTAEERLLPLSSTGQRIVFLTYYGGIQVPVPLAKAHLEAAEYQGPLI